MAMLNCLSVSLLDVSAEASKGTWIYELVYSAMLESLSVERLHLLRTKNRAHSSI